MFLGISSYSFPWATGVNVSTREGKLTEKSLIDFAVLNQIGFVQYGDNLPLHKLSSPLWDELKKHALDSGVRIELGTRGLHPENIEQYIRIARECQAGFIRMVIDDEGFHPAANEVTGIILSVLPKLADAGVILAIENHDRFPARILEEIILSTDPNYVGICLDTANSIGAGEGIHEVVSILAPYTVNLHIKDFTIKRVAHKMGFLIEGVAAGDGMLDIPWLTGQLDRTGKCKTATLEIWIEPEETIEQTLLKEKAWVEKSISYLKKIIT